MCRSILKTKRFCPVRYFALLPANPAVGEVYKLCVRTRRRSRQGEVCFCGFKILSVRSRPGPHTKGGRKCAPIPLSRQFGHKNLHKTVQVLFTKLLNFNFETRFRFLYGAHRHLRQTPYRVNSVFSHSQSYGCPKRIKGEWSSLSQLFGYLSPSPVK